ncbi:MAG TPA: amino acid permease [Planctomycetota bacterium]|nr:amino acid permease [Planctomycetota bacterium]
MNDLRRSIGSWSGTGLIVGTMIGGGIFRTPGSIASVLPDARLILALWVFFGIVTICGALTLAELATMLPQTGGTYVYLRAAYGDGSAFVFGWLYMLAAIPSGMAALAVFFGEMVLGPGTRGVPWVAIGTIVFLSTANVVGVRLGAAIQNTLAAVKVSALAVMIAWSFASGSADPSRWTAAPSKEAGWLGLAAAAQSVMFTYNGWVYVSLVAGELLDAERRLTRIILAGTGTVIGIYLLANLAYLAMMPVSAMPGTVVGQEVMGLLGGETGRRVMGACIMASVLGALNGLTLTKARVAYALGRDGLSFSFLGRAHPTFATPYVSILIQGAVAIVLVLSLRRFDRLTNYFVLMEWLALLFGIAAVFILRRKMADAPRPYRTPGYPWVPLVFVAGTALGLAAILVSSCAKRDFAPLAGLGIVAAGFPVYWIWKRKYNAPRSEKTT